MSPADPASSSFSYSSACQAPCTACHLPATSSSALLLHSDLAKNPWAVARLSSATQQGSSIFLILGVNARTPFFQWLQIMHPYLLKLSTSYHRLSWLAWEGKKKYLPLQMTLWLSITYSVHRAAVMLWSIPPWDTQSISLQGWVWVLPIVLCSVWVCWKPVGMPEHGVMPHLLQESRHELFLLDFVTRVMTW